MLDGDLILVGKGDLTLGGRGQKDKLLYGYIDHIYANDLPGASLIPIDPLIKWMRMQLLLLDRTYPGYQVINQVKTIAKGGETTPNITSDASQTIFYVKGTIAADSQEILRVYPIVQLQLRFTIFTNNKYIIMDSNLHRSIL